MITICNYIDSTTSKTKVAIFVKQGLQSFLGDVINILSTEFEVKEIIISSNNLKEIDDGMDWADICWFEWCDELIEYGSKHKLATYKKIVCRIHSYEVFTDYPSKVNWSTVDKVIFVADHIRDFALSNFSMEKERTVIIPNGIDTDKYKFRMGESGFNIAYVGYINYKKGPMLLLQTFKAIYDYDSRYKLYIAGAFQDHRDILYFKQMIEEWQLQKSIIYEGWQDNLDTWMEDKNYILCTSILESQNISVMQAMSKGIKPIIHNFVGASKIYPKELVFNTISEAIEILNSDYNSKNYRSFIEDNYSLSLTNNMILSEVKNLVEAFETTALVSVIMAVYNREKYVKEAIESVLNQSYKNIELIIINDGSTDNSEAIIKGFSDPRIKYFSNENKGQLNTLKFGYQRALGDFITRVDSDDFIHIDYIKTCLKEMLTNPKLQFVYTDFNIVNSEGTITSISKFKDYSTSIELLMDVFTEGTSLIPDVAFFKKEYISNVILNYTEQNVPFYIDNLLCNLYSHINKPLYYYRQHRENFAKDNDNFKIVIEGNVKFIDLLFRRYFIQMNLNNDFLENRTAYYSLIYKYLNNLAKYYTNTLNFKDSKKLKDVPESITKLGENWLNKENYSKSNKLNFLVKGDINKRILLVSTDDPLDGKAVGGKHTHIHLLQKGLREDNIPSKLIVSRFNSEISIDVNRTCSYMLEQIDLGITQEDIENSQDASFFYFVYAIQKQLEEKIEKALLQNYYTAISCQDVIATMAAYRVCNKIKFIIPIVTTLHGYFTNENVDYGALFSQSNVYKYFIEYEKKAYEVSDKIISVDTRIKNYVEDYSLTNAPTISVLKNAADDLSFRKDLDNSNEDNRNIILVPRRLVPKNGVIFAVKAMAELLNRGFSNFKLVIAGDGIERESIMQYINENSINCESQKTRLCDVVELLGNVPHDEIHKLYKKSRFILIPSIKSNNIEEATSVALLEGMACEKVVIASNIGGMKEIIVDGVNGFLVDSTDTITLANKLIEVITLSEEKYTLIAKKAAFDIKENYGYKGHSKKFIKLLEDESEAPIKTNPTLKNKTSIVILTYNNLNFTKECIKSLRENTNEADYEIIIVDNASTDGTREWLLKENNIKLVLNNENVGFPKGCNLGIEAANKENDILLLNNDTVVYPNWLENLKTALYSCENIGAVGSSTAGHYVGRKDKLGNFIDFIGNDMAAIESFAIENNVSDKERWSYTNRLIGFCMLIKRNVLDKVGYLDEVFSPGTYEDNDLSLRIIKEGYNLLICYDSYVHHYAGTSFDYKSDSYTTLLKRNSEIFAKKWGFGNTDLYRIRHQLTSLIMEDKYKTMNILQWQCDLGGTLLELKEKFPNAKLYAIEEDTNLNQFLSSTATLSNKTSFPLEFKEDFFDYILIGNEITMVQNPKEYLINLKKYLKKDGYLLLEIQNLMHYTVIKNIINGNWNYEAKKNVASDSNNTSEILMRNNTLLLNDLDICRFLNSCGYFKIYIFTWDYIEKKDDEAFIELLNNVSAEDNSKLYTTYLYTIKCNKKE